MIATADQRWDVIQHIVFPASDARADVLPLYVRSSDEPEVLSRRSLRLRAGAEVSFATYFGGLPAGSWIAHTSVRVVRLRLVIDGSAVITVHATDVAGRETRLSHHRSEGEAVLEVTLDERAGGWLWFTMAAENDVVLREAEWLAPNASPERASVAVAITTFDRVADCLAVVARLRDDTVVADRITRILVVDQGESKVRADPLFASLSRDWGNRLEVIEQPNLGGSGGFSRGMLEAERTDASHVLLLDDDVRLEPESLHRMLAFVDHAQGEPIVGAQMLSLIQPTLLHSYGETVELQHLWWTPVASALAPVDVAAQTVDSTPALSRTYAVDFNGWWMCLIPLPVVRRSGASMPFFIKWDDAEFGLRAKAAGHRTVTLPGAALWHMPWTAKDDGLDWQAYFQLRNRLVTALLHAPRGRRTRLLLSTFSQDVNHVFCLQYGSAALRSMALSDVLDGPGHLFPSLTTASTEAREVIRRFDQIVVPDADLPRARYEPREVHPPQGKGVAATRLISVIRNQLRSTPTPSADVQVVLQRSEGKWWRLGLVDSACVRSATGAGAFVARRDRRTAVHQVRTSVRLHVRLWLQWRRMARDYRATAPALASLESWRTVFSDDT